MTWIHVLLKNRIHIFFSIAMLVYQKKKKMSHFAGLFSSSWEQHCRSACLPPLPYLASSQADPVPVALDFCYLKEIFSQMVVVKNGGDSMVIPLWAQFVKKNHQQKTTNPPRLPSIWSFQRIDSCIEAQSIHLNRGLRHFLKNLHGLGESCWKYPSRDQLT